MSPLHGTTPLPLPRPLPASAPPHSTRRGERFELPALAASVAAARSRIALRVGHWGLPDTIKDTAELVISELFTNAIVHTDSDVVRCRIEATGALRLLIEVTDQGPGLAKRAPHPADADAEHGRGLLLLDALAARWGVIAPDRATGCTVWAEIRP
ncbi:ATP-binding protein [Streptomyces marincola]|uniref:ATP-binding protein n=1 Tax=Streptomyces marincola TaxID=2878388 RepID=UPI001CF5B4C5|nr:ATP-binding protein [Streptomyces marincola]UCM86993.1 ATP-binding protein [Streptomyces marincola]